MNIQRFTGATAREALGKARLAFGDGTLILSNRQTANGVEVMATAEESLGELDQRQAPPSAGKSAASTAGAGASAAAGTDASSARLGQQRVEEDTAQLAMSTLSFQDYVRERMLRKRTTESPARSVETHPQVMMPRQSVPAASSAPASQQAPQRSTAQAVAPRVARPAAPTAPREHREPAIGARGIVDELHAMRAMIEDRFNTFAWLGETKQHPIHSNLMLKLMRAGFSPALSRAVLEHMPEAPAAEVLQWMLDALERNLKTHAVPLQDEGGVYALVGATGVGKTTTVAKLAGQCARAHGAASVGMITLDTQRVGAHDQLREHGRNLGLVAHLAHDRAALQDLLGLFANKKLVLIDTTGVAPRDPDKDDSLSVLDLPGIQRLLVLNAGTHGDTLDEVVTAFRAAPQQQVVLSKVDEAVKLGPALDVVIRHQLLLRGTTHGQKVPEDWSTADAGELVRASMRSNGKNSAFDPKVGDLNFFFMQPGSQFAGSTPAHA